MKQNKLFFLLLSAHLSLACSSTGGVAEPQRKSDAPKSYNTETILPSASKASIPNIEGRAELTLKQIMSDPDWLGRQPTSPKFSPLGNEFVYKRKQAGSVIQDLYVTQENQGNGEKVALSDYAMYDHSNLINDKDYDFVAWIYEGNVFVQDKITAQVTQLTRDNTAARNLHYYQKNALSFQKGNAFYTVDIKSGKQQQLFEWKFAEQPKALEAPADYIAEEQQSLIKYVQVQRKNRQDRFDRAKALEQANQALNPPIFYFDKNDTTVLASVSPNGRYAVIATRENVASRDDSDIMPDYIEETGRIASQPVRRRVADAEPVSHKIFFLDLAQQSKKELSYVSLPGYNEDVLADVKRENAEAKGKKYVNNRLPRDIGLLYNWYATQIPIKWHDSESVVAIMLEAWDNKDRWIVTVDVNDPKFTVQHRLHDKAWINYRHNQFGWFDDEKTLFYLSEESGYSHLYTKSLDAEPKAMTKGRYIVDNPSLTLDDQYIYYKANKKHPGIYEIYRVDTSNGKSEAITDLNGMTDYVLSPKEDRLLLTHSSLAMPPELYSVNVNDGTKASRITNTVSQEFLSINWTVPSIVAIPSSHTEQPIYSRVYLPENTDTKLKRAVVFNHGAGYLQNAHLGWSGYFREFMFHSLLVSKGYVVLDMDYRASAGYGRDWRTAIYRQMGTPEVQDLKDGVNWLVENANVDRKRIGTYGGSYGGFLTFMSMFNEPELFQAGAALRPVSDWAHYNTPYTSNILNTPDVDPIAYERSSPIYFAEGLSKPLLINAPMVDNNVFFVDVVRLVQRFIELEKEDFETAIYPVEPHGFVQPSSWLDEYRRIFKLMEENL